MSLSEEQKRRIDENRQKALLLRANKVPQNPVLNTLSTKPVSSSECISAPSVNPFSSRPPSASGGANRWNADGNSGVKLIPPQTLGGVHRIGAERTAVGPSPSKIANGPNAEGTQPAVPPGFYVTATGRVRKERDGSRRDKNSFGGPSPLKPSVIPRSEFGSVQFGNNSPSKRKAREPRDGQRRERNSSDTTSSPQKSTGTVRGRGSAVKVKFILISKQRFAIDARFFQPLVELFHSVNSKQYGEYEQNKNLIFF